MTRTEQQLHLLLVNALYPAHESKQEHQACLTLINNLKLKQRVTLITDFLLDAQSLATLQAADLIVSPYQQTQESSSGAVCIGLASARPVAVTTLSIFDDVSQAFHRLPGADPQAIAQGLRALLDSLHAQEAKTRQWPVLSTWLLNIIGGLANPLPLPNAASL